MNVPMCVICGEYEAGTFTGSVMFCSEKCEDIARDDIVVYDTDGDMIYMGVCDDDPSPYTGTYSEE